MQEDRKRVLDMLEDGRITADEAMMLLEQLGDDRPKGAAAFPAEPAQAAENPRGEKMLRVRVLVMEQGNPKPTSVHVNLPLKLARVAGRLATAMPRSASDAMRAHGVDLSDIDWEEAIDALADTGGDIVNVTHEDDHEQVTVRVFVE